MIDYCIQTGRLYESLPYHDCVFIGRDLKGQPRYAALRQGCERAVSAKAGADANEGGMETVKEYQGTKIIDIDSDYGNIKTANCYFPAGLTAATVRLAVTI